MPHKGRISVDEKIRLAEEYLSGKDGKVYTLNKPSRILSRNKAQCYS